MQLNGGKSTRSPRHWIDTESTVTSINWRPNVNVDGCRVLVRIELRHLCSNKLHTLFCVVFFFLHLDSMKLSEIFGDSVRDIKYNRMQISNGLNAQTDRNTHSIRDDWKLAIVMSRQWQWHNTNCEDAITITFKRWTAIRVEIMVFLRKRLQK